MFSHIHLGVGDFEGAFAFYDGLMKVLGNALRFCEPAQPWAGWQSADGRPLFLIGPPFDGEAHRPGNGQMIAFTAASPEIVREAYEYALAHECSDEGAPGLRPHYHANYYGAYFRDADGNKICVVCHEAAV